MRRSIALVVVSGLAASMAQAQDIQWNNGSGGSWNLAGNWNPTNIPDTAAERAILSLPGLYTVTVSTSVGVGQVWISNPQATLAISNAQILDVVGPQLTNDGTILVNPTSGGSGTYLRISGPVVLDGVGNLRLNGSLGNVATAGLIQSGAQTLTHSAGHTIHGHGLLAVGFVNNGTINADVPTGAVSIQSSGTNNALITATNDGRIDVSGVTITQGANGQLVSNGGTVRFLSSGVVGGVVTSVGTVPSQVAASSTFDSVTQNGLLDVNNAQILAVVGSGLTNNGTVTINPGAGGSGTLMRFDADGMLGGTGTVALNANAGNVDTAYVGRSGIAVYTNGPSHTIRGTGALHGSMVNNGVIDADVNGRAMNIDANPMTNNAAIRATGGGVLQFIGNTVANGAGTITSDASTVNFASMGLTGGTINVVNGGIGRITASSTFTDATVNGPLEVNNAQILVIGGSGIAHTGTITVNPQAGGSGTLMRFDAAGSMTGTGAVVLNANPGNLDTAYISRSGALVYTNAAGHTIRGTGSLHGAMINQGLINADLAGRFMNIDAATTNTATIAATNGSTLQFIGNTVINSGGTVLCDASTVNFASMGLNGGLVNVTNGGIARVTASSTFTNVTVSGPLEVNNAQILAVAGSGLNHTGTITVNPGAGGSGTFIRFDETGAFTGSGVVALHANAANLDTGYINRSGSSVYTNGPQHVIRGMGRLYGAMINDGLVSVDQPGDAIEILATTTNNNVIEAINGGTLQFTGSTVQNVNGTISATNSTANFNSMNLVGGTLNATANGVARIISSSSFRDVNANGAITVNNAQILAIAGSGINHTGTITINTQAGGSGTLMRFDESGTLSGTGTLVLNANPANFDTGYLTSSGASVVTNGVGHTIGGRGRIYGNFVNLGNINPGAPGGGTGYVRREGNYTATSTSIHSFDLGGTAQGTTYDLFAASGSMQLGGTLNVGLTNGFIPSAGTVFTVMAAASITGSFTTVNLPPLPPSLGYPRLQITPTQVNVRVPICPSDWNGDGTRNSQDFFDFLSAFFSGSSDFNFDGLTNSQDFFDFLTSFFGGCAG